MKVSNFVLGSLVTCAGHSWAFPVEETSVTQLETRQDPVTSVVEVAIGVYAIFAGATAAKVVLKGVANAFKATFGGQKAPYEEKGNCLIEFHTQGGVSNHKPLLKRRKPAKVFGRTRGTEQLLCQNDARFFLG